MSQVLKELQMVLDARKNASAQTSYVASLHHKGLNKILEKVGEECTEVILAAKDASHCEAGSPEKQALIGEVADLWFHTLVALSHLDLTSQDVLNELSRRFDMSGLEEKRQRHPA